VPVPKDAAAGIMDFGRDRREVRATRPSVDDVVGEEGRRLVQQLTRSAPRPRAASPRRRRWNWARAWPRARQFSGERALNSLPFLRGALAGFLRTHLLCQKPLGLWPNWRLLASSRLCRARPMRHLYCTASKAEVPFLVEGSAQDRARRGNVPKMPTPEEFQCR